MTTLCPMCKKALSAAEVAGGFCGAGHAGSSDIAWQLVKQMTTTLCGYERADLVWAIEYARDIWADDETVLRNLQSVEWRPKDPRRFDAMSTVIDPARLAELMAEELRGRGVDAQFKEWPKRDHGDIIWGLRRQGTPHYDKCGGFMGMPQARAALLRLMQLPEDTAADDVLKAMGATDAA